MTIDLYTWSTPNGRKASIMLEECGLDYAVHPVDITAGAQHAPAFLAISPNNRIPAIVDPDGPGGGAHAVFESGAILVYLAGKCGRLYPEDPAARSVTLQRLMWQMGGFGPMLGQAHHFLKFNPGTARYAETRYRDEARRLYGVLDRRLAQAEYAAGDAYTVADIAIFPWAARHEWQHVDLADFPQVRRWYDAVAARPAVARGMAVPAA